MLRCVTIRRTDRFVKDRNVNPIRKFLEETRMCARAKERRTVKRIERRPLSGGKREKQRRIEMGEGLLTECGFKKKWGHVFSVKLLGP